MRTSPNLLVHVAGGGDRAIWAGDLATVGDLVAALNGDRQSTIVVHRTGQALPLKARLQSADLCNGDTITLRKGSQTKAAEVNVDSVTLNFLSGPRKDDEIKLGVGEATVGRASDNDVVVIDPGVSRHHVSVKVDREGITVSDTGSTNGVTINNRKAVDPVAVRSGDRVLIGNSWFQILYSTTLIESGRITSPSNRHRVLITPGSQPYAPYEGGIVHFPAAPSRGRVLRRVSGSAFQAAVSLFGRSLQAAGAALIKEIDTEWSARRREAPAVVEVAEAVASDRTQLWSRGQDDPLLARIGLASLPSRIKCIVPPGGDEEQRLRCEAVVAQHREIDDVPVTVDLGDTHSVLVTGDEVDRRRLAYAIVAQLAAQHSPERVRVWGLFGPEQADKWDWLKWLPHCSSIEADDGHTQTAADPARYGEVVERLASEARRPAPETVGDHEGQDSTGNTEKTAEEIGGETAEEIDGETDRDHSASTVSPGVPHELLVIEANAEAINEYQSAIETMVSRSGLGVTVLIVAPADTSRRLELPFGYEGSIVVVEGGSASLEMVQGRSIEALTGIKHEVFGLDDTRELAMTIAPAVVAATMGPAAKGGALDSGNPSADGDVIATEPGRLDELVPDGDTDVVVQRWAEHPSPGRLVATLGQNKTGPVRIDLRELGPHGLILGDLDGMPPAWLASLAASYSPRDLNFYLIDSTPGSVFRSCTDLPHTIGSLVDPSALEVKSALAMLSAEMDRRQAVLTSLDCDSIEVLERQGQPAPFPYLIVAVDRADKLGDLDERARGDVVSLDAPAELLTLADRGQELGVHLLIGAVEDDRLSQRVPLSVLAKRSASSIVTVGQAPPISFTAMLALPPSELVVGEFGLDGFDELNRLALPVDGEDELVRVTELIREAHESSGDPSPSMLS